MLHMNVNHDIFSQLFRRNQRRQCILSHCKDRCLAFQIYVSCMKFNYCHKIFMSKGFPQSFTYSIPKLDRDVKFFSSIYSFAVNCLSVRDTGPKFGLDVFFFFPKMASGLCSIQVLLSTSSFSLV